MKTKIAAVISGLMLVSALGCASANPSIPAPAQTKPDIFSTLTVAKISLDDAIKTAEQTVAGKLVKAELANDRSPNTYRVAIADSNSRTVTYMKIDSSTGKILRSKIIHPDQRAANAAGKKGVAKPVSGAPSVSATPTGNPLKTPSTTPAPAKP